MIEFYIIMYITAFLLFGCSVFILATGTRNCCRHLRTSERMKQIRKIRDEPLLSDQSEFVNDEFDQYHHDVMEELRREFDMNEG